MSSPGEVLRLRWRADLLALSLVVASALACADDPGAEQARAVFERYEPAFYECKKVSEEAGARPGTHPCSRASSEALERSLDATGIDEATRDEMIAEWVRRSALGVLYADAQTRAGLLGF